MRKLLTVLALLAVGFSIGRLFVPRAAYYENHGTHVNLSEPIILNQVDPPAPGVTYHPHTYAVGGVTTVLGPRPANRPVTLISFEGGRIVVACCTFDNSP